MAHRRRWSKEEKLLILKESEEKGVTITLRKHEISHATYYQWKNKVSLFGEDSLGASSSKPDPMLKQLKKENIKLKQLLAEKELALALKEEMLKKSLVRSTTK